MVDGETYLVDPFIPEMQWGVKRKNKNEQKEKKEDKNNEEEERRRRELEEQWPWGTGRATDNPRGVRNLARRGGVRANLARGGGGVTKKIKVEPATGTKRKRSLGGATPTGNPPPRVRLAMRRTCGERLNTSASNALRPGLPSVQRRKEEEGKRERSPAPFPRDQLALDELRNLSLEATTEPLPATPATSAGDSEMPDLHTPTTIAPSPRPPTPPRGRPQGREAAPRPEERRCGRVVEFSPTREFLESVLRRTENHFSGHIPRDRRRVVLGQLEAELRRIHANIPWLPEDLVASNLIQHGVEQVRDGWLRSTHSGVWFLTERTEEELRDPRVRAREEEEYRRRIAEPVAGNREELVRRRGNIGEVRYQQERFQLDEEDRARGEGRRFRGMEERQADWQRERAEIRREIRRQEEERNLREGLYDQRQYVDDVLGGIADQLAENRDLMEEYYRLFHEGDEEDVPRLGPVADELVREREARRQRRRRQKDPLAQLTRMKAANPELMEWRHRLRVFEEILRTSHPHMRDHINALLDVEQRRVTEDARAIIRYKGIAGLSTRLDISWPPRDVVTVSGPGADSGSDTEGGDEAGGEPPEDCRRPRSPPRRNRDQSPPNGGGRRRAQLVR